MDGDTADFRIAVSGEAGADRPAATSAFAGSRVHAYVWPTSLDSSAVGFDPKQGIVALAVTFHPDFDDGAHGVKNSAVWHTHWVVLAKDATCRWAQGHRYSGRDQAQAVGDLAGRAAADRQSGLSSGDHRARSAGTCSASQYRRRVL